MAIYGLSVFLETPKASRKGRTRYIVVSVIITLLAAFSASLDMAVYFQVLFQATSPTDWQMRLQGIALQWRTLLSGVCVAVLVWIGDALLVS